MKSSVLPLFFSIIILSGCSASSSTAKQEKKAAQYEEMVALIDGGTFEFTVRSANPSGGQSVQITSSYTLEAKEGIYKAYLPYFGRSHNASYGGDGGVEFEGEPADLNITKNDEKKSISIKFNIKNKDERYDCNLLISSGGTGTLTVSSSKRTPISYYGGIAEPVINRSKKDKQ